MEIAPAIRQINPEILDSKEYLLIMDQVVSYFHRKWRLADEERDDLYQDVYLSFKERQMRAVINGFNPELGIFEDYFRRAVYNRCRELLRSKNKKSRLSAIA